ESIVVVVRPRIDSEVAQFIGYVATARPAESAVAIVMVKHILGGGRKSLARRDDEVQEAIVVVITYGRASVQCNIGIRVSLDDLAESDVANVTVKHIRSAVNRGR